MNNKEYKKMDIKKANSILHVNEDKELELLVDKEKQRQLESLELIASENFTSVDVMRYNGSVLTNKYSEGQVGKRYYGGNEFIDEIETLTKKRAIDLFNLDPNIWSVNVQSYSGTPANFSIYTALLNSPPQQQKGENNTILGMKLSHGGHLSHGHKNTNSFKYFNTIQYGVDKNGIIDYTEVEELAIKHKPKLIIIGASGYSRDYNYKRFREIADKVKDKEKTYLMADISHTSGLIAHNLLDSPFKYVDIVMTTTHKTLRGPRGALIYCKEHLKNKIDNSVFPGSQGGPHNNTIAAIATTLKQAKTEEFKYYITQVKNNANVLANELSQKYNFKVVSGGTDNHLILIDLSNKKLSGKEFELKCEKVNISINSNSVPGNENMTAGIRIGTAAMTSRNMKEEEFKFIAKVLNLITSNDLDITKMKNLINNFCKKYPLPTQ